jgi:pantothenate kinase type III
MRVVWRGRWTLQLVFAIGSSSVVAAIAAGVVAVAIRVIEEMVGEVRTANGVGVRVAAIDFLQRAFHPSD